MTITKNSNLNKARKLKNDEFYTSLSDIEHELCHYKQHFKNKIVFCNCDDPTTSNFWKYFSLNFDFLGLKKLIATHYDKEKPTYKLERTAYGDKYVTKTPLKGNGDFRSPEAIELLKEADIVVTNPPFSLFREYVSQLISYNKKFLIIGNTNAITYKEIFPLIKENKMRLGYNSHFNTEFVVPENYDPRGKQCRIDENGRKIIKMGPITWYTNLRQNKINKPLELYCRYYGNEHLYPKYDNYDIIEVSKTVNIPYDYDGIMGVPITFLTKYNPEQFEILGLAGPARWIGKECFTIINGKKIYNRILIRRKGKAISGKENEN